MPVPANIRVCLFPYLNELLVLDLRAAETPVQSLKVSGVFGSDFFRAMENKFSCALREMSEYPLTDLMHPTKHFKKAIRDATVTYLIDKLDLSLERRQDSPPVAVYVINGRADPFHLQAMLNALPEFPHNSGKDLSLYVWKNKLADMAARERRIAKQLDQQEPAQTVRGETVEDYTLRYAPY